MAKSWYMVALCAGMLGASALAGCKSSTTNNGGGSNDAGGSAADGGGKADGGDPDTIPAPDKPNPLCPQKIDPITGIYAPKGKCCYRTANSTRLDAQGDGALDTMEYRLNYSQTTNHPMSIGLGAIVTLTKNVAALEQQSHLFRIQGPRMGGKVTMGPGKVRTGMGAYNCGKGTYSFYSDKAAPVRTDAPNLTDASRWHEPEVTTKVDGSKMGIAQDVPVWATNPNRGYAYTPYLDMSTYKLDYELIAQGFEIEDMQTGDDALNCVGEIKSDNTGWTAGGHFKVYANMEINDHDGISALNEQTMCQLMAFGVVSDITGADVQCKTTLRCKPGSTKCTWIKLPESLCPETKADQAMWGCHIGDPNNVDKEKTNCTMDKVTTTLDPDNGAKTEGQCCDPMGKSTTLPACNAYMIRNEFVAAAASITDADTDTIQQKCVK